MADRLADPSGAPPIAIWLAIFLLTGLLLAGLAAWVAADPSDSNPFLMKDAGCASSFDAQARGPAIVAVGTSLLAHGVGPSFQASLPGARWRACWANGGQWRDAVATLPRIESEHPAILLIHEGVFGVAPPPLQQRFFASVSRKLRRALGLRQIEIRMDCATLSPPDAAAWQAYHDRVVQIPELTEVAAWIARFQAEGTRVVLLDIPRTPAAEAKLGSQLEERRSKLKKLAAASGAAYWSFPAPVAADAYCPDHSHMAPAGERQFEQELAERLRTSLQGLPR